MTGLTNREIDFNRNTHGLSYNFCLITIDRARNLGHPVVEKNTSIITLIDEFNPGNNR